MQGRTIGRWMALGVAWCAAPVGAQQVLDRVDPAARGAERASDGPSAAPRPAPIEVETRVATAPVGQGAVTIGAVVFSGLTRLTPADFADLIDPYLGKAAGPAELKALAEKVAARLRARGFVFGHAAIAPQRLASGVLTVTIDEGRIDAVRVTGASEPAVEAALRPLASGEPATLADVERRLLLAGDVDGVRVRSSRFVREGGRGVLLVAVERTSVSGRLAIRNDGTAPLGPIQSLANLSVAGVAAADDVLSLTHVGTPLEPGELNYGRIRYAKRISPLGTELAVSGSLSAARPGGYLEPFRIRSRSWVLGLSVLHPLERRRTTSLWLDAELDLRDLD